MNHDYDLLRIKRTIDEAPRKSLWRHSKTSHLYEIVGVVMIESTWRPGILYIRQEPEDGDVPILIVRDAEEFLDGRFVREED